MIATIWLMIAGCFNDYKSGVDPDGDGIPWPVDSDNTDSSAGEDCTYLRTELDYYTYNCDGVGYFYDVVYVGWGRAPELYIYETSPNDNPWNEVHSFPSTPEEYDPNGCSELYYLELNTVEEIAEVVEGSTTLFGCDQISALSWLIYVYSVGGYATECGAWGDDVDAINEFFGADCPTI